MNIYFSQAWRPFLYMCDAAWVTALWLSQPLEKVSRQVFNVAGGNYQKWQLVDMVKQHFPRAAIQMTESQVEPRDYRVSTHRVAEVLGFQPEHPIEQAFREVSTALQQKLWLQLPEAIVTVLQANPNVLVFGP